MTPVRRGLSKPYRQTLDFLVTRYAIIGSRSACRDNLSEGKVPQTDHKTHKQSPTYDSTRNDQFVSLEVVDATCWLVRRRGFLRGLCVSLMPSSANYISVVPPQACVVEVLEGERRKWERCEWERRAMFAEDEVSVDKEMNTCFLGGALESEEPRKPAKGSQRWCRGGPTRFGSNSLG